ncbi:pseudouridine synthase [Desulfoplanes formicivorans]|uniref:Pseudouridine synthase n=1 Tax=Desulfoplanes formicivorans TaxID=1592317 RepID=A0A194AIZ5_9BACT|nr:pseudouridine synthase [Desulfoplanes formicivorans]GAU09205.1 pseudouridine synthase [Desulfoplanes formicivorans]
MTMNHSRNRQSSPPSPQGPSVRINKAIAQAGVCSRRKADELLAQGRVKVNGRTITSPGLQVDPSRDTICVDGKPVSPAGQTSRPVYLLLHKPIRTVTTLRDPAGRPTVIDLLPPFFRKKRVFPVGRLDYYSEGLLLLTTDGDLTQKMTHPSYNHPKTYEVEILGMPTRGMLHVMRQGMTLAEGERLRPVDVTILGTRGNRTTLSMVLRQGVNRQIRRMCRDLGFKVLKLKRTSQGPLHLGDLKPGAFRELTPEEVRQLKKSVQQKRDTPVKD